jgi:hypothetical protein
MDTKQKTKFLLSGGEKDIDDVIPVVEFCNMKNDHREICIKVCKEIMSNSLFN